MRRTRLRADPAKTRAWQQRSREAALEREQAAEAPRPRRRPQFRAALPARLEPCAKCGNRASAWHHWLSQEEIGMYVRSLRLRDDDEEYALERRLLHDPRNLSAVCYGCHGNGSLEHAAPLRAVGPPASAFNFAAELGPEWLERLRRAYPASVPNGAAAAGVTSPGEEPQHG